MKSWNKVGEGCCFKKENAVYRERCLPAARIFQLTWLVASQLRANVTEPCVDQEISWICPFPACAVDLLQAGTVGSRPFPAGWMLEAPQASLAITACPGSGIHCPPEHRGHWDEIPEVPVIPTSQRKSPGPAHPALLQPQLGPGWECSLWELSLDTRCWQPPPDPNISRLCESKG